MAKKGNKKARPAGQNSPPASGNPERYSLDIPEDTIEGKNKEEKTDMPERKLSQDQLKWAAVILLVALVMVLAAFFLNSAKNDFVPGQEVAVDQFKDALISAKNVYIVMDVRGAQNDTVRGSIMQCGIDFSGSTFLGSKTVVPFSFADDGCTGANGTRSVAQCASELNDGITIDIRQGQPAVRYFSNGMIVAIGPEYAQGTCGIKINTGN